MKRLVGLLLVMGIDGCGGGSTHEGETASPEQDPAGQAVDADAAAALKKLGAAIERNGNSEVWIVSLNKTQVTDVGLVHLKGLTNLQELDLSITRVTDAHFQSASKTQRFKKRAKSDADGAPQGRLAWTAVH